MVIAVIISNFFLLVFLFSALFNFMCHIITLNYIKWDWKQLKHINKRVTLFSTIEFGVSIGTVLKKGALLYYEIENKV